MMLEVLGVRLSESLISERKYRMEDLDHFFRGEWKFCFGEFGEI